MQKIVVHRPGGFERLQLETHPEPRPGAGEVRVEIRAAGVNYADCVVRMGLYKSAREYVGWPITPGFEFAGVVSELGAGTHGVQVGQRVLGVTRFGGYASALCVPVEQVLPLPARLSFAQGATFPTVFLTAWYALEELGQLRPEYRVLVHAAAGGVGSAAVQLAKRRSARVVGVVGAAAKRSHVEGLGADCVIDKSSEDWAEAARRDSPAGYQIVLDANGPRTLRDSYRLLAPTGRLVVYGFHGMMPRRRGLPNPLRLLYDFLRIPRFSPLRLTDENRAIFGFNLSYLFDQSKMLRAALEALLADLAEGALRPLPVEEYPLDRAADAQRALQSGRTVGKLALVP